MHGEMDYSLRSTLGVDAETGRWEGVSDVINVFDAARVISAREVAEREGLRLQRRGSRCWACCPLHDEKTASMAFYEDGGWHCFGCGACGSDGASFLAAVRSISQFEAARTLTGLNREECARAPKSGQRLRRLLEGNRIRKQVEMCDVIHDARAIIDDIQDRASNWDACWDNPLFVAALDARSAAEIEYEQLALASPEELLRMAVINENNERSAS